jgi:hypothetical protein
MLIDIHSTDGRLAVAPPQDSRLCSTLQAAFFAFPVVGFRTHNICLAVLQIPRWSSAAAKRKFARCFSTSFRTRWTNSWASKGSVCGTGGDFVPFLGRIVGP